MTIINKKKTNLLELFVIIYIYIYTLQNQIAKVINEL